MSVYANAMWLDVQLPIVCSCEILIFIPRDAIILFLLVLCVVVDGDEFNFFVVCVFLLYSISPSVLAQSEKEHMRSKHLHGLTSLRYSL